MENILVLVIVGLAVFFIGRKYYRKYTQKNQCSCGCTSCPTDASTCDLPEANAKLPENQKG